MFTNLRMPTACDPGRYAIAPLSSVDPWNGIHAVTVSVSVDGPVRVVLVRIGGASAGLLVQRLVVPQPDAVDAEQLGRGLTERGWNVSGRIVGIVLPQVDALVERLRVRGALLERRRVALAVRDGFASRAPRSESSSAAVSSPSTTTKPSRRKSFDDRGFERASPHYPAGSSLRPSVAHHDAVSRSPSTLPRGWISSNTRR